MPIHLRGGDTIVLRKVDRDYDPTSRADAFKHLRDRFNAGEITTGLLYVNEDRAGNARTDAQHRYAAFTVAL